MLRQLISNALRRDLAVDDRPALAPASSARPAPDPDFPPMTALRPPAAQNDNPLTELCATVEADLRAAGYLR